MLAHLRHPFAAVCLATCLWPLAAAAQCEPDWVLGDSVPSPRGTVRASVLWDPDGAGSQPLRLVVAGSFAAAQSMQVPVASFDGTDWTLLGQLEGSASALAVHNGQLHVARSRTFVVLGIPTLVHEVLAWDGVQWNVIGSPSGTVHMMVSHAGQLHIGGAFGSIGGTFAANVAAWNGSTWTSLASGVQGTVRTLCSFGGSLWVGGTLTAASGVAVGSVAIWNGSAWSSGPVCNGSVDAMAVRSSIAINSTYLFLGGAFTQLTVGSTVIPAQHVARMNAFSLAWDGVNGGVPGTRCTSLLVRTFGINSYELAATVENVGQDEVWRLASGTWASLGTPVTTSEAPASTLAWFGGRYHVGVERPDGAVRTYTGTSWLPVNGAGLHGPVSAVAPFGNELAIGGAFADATGALVPTVARGTPGAWTVLGNLSGGFGVFAVATMPNGDLVATGSFTHADGAPCNHIARWNGSSWAPLGTGLNQAGRALLVEPNGDLIVGGGFSHAGGVQALGIARWNGVSWAPLGAGLSGGCRALARVPDGALYAGGTFQFAGGQSAMRIARFANGVWSPLGSGCNGEVTSLAVGIDGAVFAAGSFTAAGGQNCRVAKWANGAWTPVFTLGVNTTVLALAVHPNGDLFVGGEVFSFSLGPFGGWTSNVVRIRGGSSQSAENIDGARAEAMAIVNGGLVVAGSIEQAGGLVASNVARLLPPCPATAGTFGNACPGVLHPLALTAVRAPWLGGSWRVRATTFGPTGFAFRAIGFTPLPAIPLLTIFPEALPGCVGLVFPDASELLLPVNGVVEAGGAVPDDPSLIGLSIHEQMLQFEMLGSGGFAISATNALQLSVGDF